MVEVSVIHGRLKFYIYKTGTIYPLLLTVIVHHERLYKEILSIIYKAGTSFSL